MNNHRLQRRRAWRGPRFGMSIIIVLGVISIAMALSYAMLRSQTMSADIQANVQRRDLARQAAYAGMSAALRKMHNANWPGVSSTLSQNLEAHQWFDVSYATGDASLSSGSADYQEYPYRVTITSVGYAEDPKNTAIRNTYKVQTVVELVRKKLYDEPATWAAVRNFTAYHWSTGNSYTDVPVRVEGPIWMQGTMYVGSDYPADTTARTQYFSDLALMKTDGVGDYRPFNGPIHTPFSRQIVSTKTFLESGQQLTLTDVAVSTGAPASYPTGVTSYQLFPGGKAYTMPVLQTTYGTTLSNLTLGPNPETNPLGVFLSSGTLVIHNNVTVNGVILTTGATEPDIRITGANVTLQAPTLPLLAGSTTKYQLPAAIVKDDFNVQGTADCKIRGVIMAYDEFSFDRAASGAICDMKGRAVCARLSLNGRIPWDLTQLEWQTEHLIYSLQKNLTNGIKYFPVLVKATRNFDFNPLLTLKPDSADIVHRWHTFGQPVYVAHSDDPGLRWNVIQWTDNP